MRRTGPCHFAAVHRVAGDSVARGSRRPKGSGPRPLALRNRPMTSYHAAHFTEHQQRAAIWRVLSGHLATWVPPESAVLEVGAAYCHWINNVVARRRVAVDIWPGVHFAPDVAARVLDDLRYVLRRSGRLILIQPNFRYAWREYFDDYTHRAVFTDVSLPALLRA